jgi:hypothetical protein
MDLYEIVMKLVGPVQAIGDSEVDFQRFNNLKKLTILVDQLLFEIGRAAESKDRAQASMKKIGEHAFDFLEDLRHG